MEGELGLDHSIHHDPCTVPVDCCKLRTHVMHVTERLQVAYWGTRVHLQLCMQHRESMYMDIFFFSPRSGRVCVQTASGKEASVEDEECTERLKAL